MKLNVQFKPNYSDRGIIVGFAFGGYGLCREIRARSFFIYIFMLIYGGFGSRCRTMQLSHCKFRACLSQLKYHAVYFELLMDVLLLICPFIIENTKKTYYLGSAFRFN